MSRTAPAGFAPVLEFGSAPTTLAVERALLDIARGRPVVVLDDDKGHLMAAAEFITTGIMSFVVRHTSGFVCVARPGRELERLAIPPAIGAHPNQPRSAYAVSVDAAAGITTGISAADRATTARVLANPHSQATDLTRPGHVVPVPARTGGVLELAAPAEAGIDLARLAGRAPAAVLAHLVDDDGLLRCTDASRRFAERHQLAVVTVGDLVDYRHRTENPIRRTFATRIASSDDVALVGYAQSHSGRTYLAITSGSAGSGLGDAPHDVFLVRQHVRDSGDVGVSLDIDPSRDTGHVIVISLDSGLVVDESTDRDATMIEQILADLGIDRYRIA
ncbi:3,4-dihydroxy-2-butanone-4-phosphate synthase [Nocardia sp. NPDC058379]|uniref:3,4-dihydroxy-2-butanone-4-phosphate synthase n=1 Tax=unclassified Nocardia TaxID=2637762 RepID=UPI00365CC815